MTSLEAGDDHYQDPDDQPGHGVGAELLVDLGNQERTNNPGHAAECCKQSQPVTLQVEDLI